MRIRQMLGWCEKGEAQLRLLMQEGGRREPVKGNRAQSERQGLRARGFRPLGGLGLSDRVVTTCTNGRAEMLKLFAGTSGAGREHSRFDGTVSAIPATG